MELDQVTHVLVHVLPGGDGLIRPPRPPETSRREDTSPKAPFRATRFTADGRTRIAVRMADADVFRSSIPGKDLGAPGSPDASACSAYAIRVLGDAAGADMRMASLSLDVTSHALDEGALVLVVRIDKRARTIVFASCEARAAGRLVFTAQALFSREAG